MAKSIRRQRSPWRRWTSHRFLLAVEALLLIGAAETASEALVHGSPGIPDAVKILVSMLLCLGTFAVVLVFARRLTEAGLKRTHSVIQALPLPTPYLLVHVGALVGLFLLWALVLEIAPW